MVLDDYGDYTTIRALIDGSTNSVDICDVQWGGGYCTEDSECHGKGLCIENQCVCYSNYLYRVTFLRLIVMPLVFIGLALVMPINRMLAGLCVIVAAMPIAGNCSMLSDIYTPEDMTASHATIVSTLISGVTLPLLVLVMSMVGLG